MRLFKVVGLTDKKYKSKIQKIAKDAGIKIELLMAASINELEQFFINDHDLLLSFGTNIVVPDWILKKRNLTALNVHSAPPEYPGRDPHHFAVYDGVEEYGATLHIMNKKVDSGPIIAVKKFKINHKEVPWKLLSKANNASWDLIKGLFEKLSKGSALIPLPEIFWGKRVTTRKMFHDMCKLDLHLSEEEFIRRLRAFSFPGHNNLYLDFYGYKFCIENKA
jgi:methionyl-tRNA formyltransferase